MPLTLDIFNDDAFGVASLTAAINNPPEGQYVPNLLDSLFEEEGITTTSKTCDYVKNHILEISRPKPNPHAKYKRPATRRLFCEI